MKVVASWSGGKDGCFAAYLAQKQGYEVVNILTMMMTEEKSNFHLINADMLEAQSNAIGVPLIKVKTSPETYEQDFKAILTKLKTQGVEGLVTGDIYEVAGHEEGWLERVCKELDLKPIKPLWLGDTKKIYLDYINAGFKAMVIRTNLSVLGVEWLGKTLDKKFYDDILKLGNVDPCGEGGEYHTFVYDGPNFKESIEILGTEKFKLTGGFGYLDIKGFKIIPKDGKSTNEK
jgi:uncharacterized protein (TIGR00290 family)